MPDRVTAWGVELPWQMEDIIDPATGEPRPPWRDLETQTAPVYNAAGEHVRDMQVTTVVAYAADVPSAARRIPALSPPVWLVLRVILALAVAALAVKGIS